MSREVKIVRELDYREGTFCRNELDKEGWKVMQVVPKVVQYIEYEYVLEREKP